MLTRCILIPVILFSGWLQASGLNPKYQFNALTSQLSQVSVTDIIQDEQGFTWVGTQDGLNRFDGHQVKVYLRESPTGQVAHNFIRQLLLTAQGELLVLTNNGILQYERDSDRFVASKRFAGLQDLNQTTSIAEGQSGALWIGSSQGHVVRLALSGDVSRYYIASREIERPVYINHIFVDHQNTVWLSTREGLWTKREVGHDFSAFTIALPQQGVDPYFPVENTAQHHDKLLVATFAGLLAVDLNTYQITALASAKAPNGLKDIRVRHVYVSGNDIWLATFQGLYRKQSNALAFSNIDYRPRLQQELADQIVNRVYQDAKGFVWVGTERYGLVYTHLSLNQIQHFTAKNNAEECLSGDPIYALSAIDEQSLWVAVWGRGLHRINQELGNCEFFSQHSDPLINDALKIIVSITRDQNGGWWFGTAGFGVLHYEQGNWRLFANHEDESKGLKNLDVFALLQDQNTLWLGTQGGLAAFDLIHEKFTHYSYLPINGTERVAQIFSLAKNENSDDLWVGTQHGLTRFNTQTRQPDLKQIPQRLLDLSTPVYSLALDRAATLWIGTGGTGIWSLDNAQALSHFDSQQGLPNNTVYAIEVDSSGRVWGSTNNGLFNIQPDADSVRSFTVRQGLQGKEFSTAHAINAQKNRVYFAGLNGFNVVQTTHLKTGPQIFKPVITGFLLNNKPFELQQSTRYTNGRSISSSSSLQLDYYDKFVGFEFASFNYLSGQDTRFRYQLQGYHDDWLEVPENTHSASFTNLPSGRYQLVINATDYTGQWSEQSKVLAIHVSPPWWLSWWMQTMYGALLLIIPWCVHIYRSKALRQRAAKLETAVKLRTQELAVQKKVVENLLQQKNNEFINISHEFRTPLTLILGPVKRMLEKASNSEQSALKLIQSNAERLLRLVDELLEIEKLKVNQALPKQTYRVDECLNELVFAYEYAATNAGLAYSANITPELIVEMYPDALEKIVANLLSNAIKYNQEGGSVALAVYVVDENLVIQVRDTGIGLTREARKKVFDKFQRVNRQSLQIQGSGVGLAVVQEIAQAHGGRVTLDSKPGVGSQFTVTMPCLLEEANLSESSIEHETVTVAGTEDDAEWQNLDDNQPVVLVIEDDPGMRFYIKEVVSEHFQCVAVSDGEKGIELAAQLIPDIIISDVMMPGISGHEVCRRLKSQEMTSHIPVLMLTARVDKESRLQSWELLADDYLTKPFDDDELIVRLSSILKLRATLHQHYSTVQPALESASDTPAESAVKRSNRLNNKVAEEPSLTASNEPSETAVDTADQAVRISERDQQFLDKINALLAEHFAREELSVEWMAQQLFISDRQLRRKLKGLMGMTPNEVIKNFRLERAMTLLKKGEKPSSVSFAVGFSSHSYFSQEFKKYTGVSPADY